MSKILILLEGEKLDKNIIENLKDIHKFNDNIEVIIYKTNIHILYDHIKNEYGPTWPVKIIPLLRKRIQNFNLQDSDIGQIYLFFDSDMQAPQANNERLEEMFKYFNDETKNGKLYISYPMVEAFFDIDFEQEEYYKNKEIMGTDYVNYKSDKNVKVNTLKHQDILKDKNKIDIIFKQNIKKLNYIVNTDFSFLDYKSYSKIRELDIFNFQVKKYGDLKIKVSVLSPFPKFFIDYFGKPLYEELTKTNNTI
ncbi:hypothetical protein ACW0TP_07190 [Fusobacterium polymorphum]